MRKKKRSPITPLVIVLALALAGWLLYQIPAVHERLYWRVDVAQTYLRGILEWIANAKTPVTRAKRIEETARLARQNLRANQWRK